MAGELLSHLRQRAVTLVETELPTVEELRSVVGALVYVIEEIAGDEIDRLAPVEAPDTGEDATPPVTSAPPVPAAANIAEAPAPVEPVIASPVPADVPLSDAEQAQLDALLARAQANAEPAPTDPPPVDDAGPGSATTDAPLPPEVTS